MIVYELGLEINQPLEKIKQKNNKLQMVKIYLWFTLGKRTLSSLFVLTQSHDCKTCTFDECFSKYYLESLIVDKL
jgi:hypothetical protein